MGARLGALLGAATLLGVACLDFDVFEGTASPGGAGGSASDGGGGSGGNIPASCTNMMLDDSESDVDCGGICPNCPNGDMCGNGQDCVSGFCSSGTCAPCVNNADCADLPDTWCDGGTCVPLQDNGASCDDAGECVSNACSDSVCCDTACDQTCESCVAAETGAGPDGTCAPIVGTTDPADECPGATDVCNGSGSCGPFCGMTPAATERNCPAVCDGGCAGGICAIDCQTSSCAGQTKTCPPGWPCSVNCNGNTRCDGVTVNCPAYHACSVSCDGQNACRDATVSCSGSGACSVACANENNVCEGMMVGCGANSCAATCGSVSKPTLACGTSCNCMPCP